ncbi:hypothetical protein N7513_000921 [Penicillium frequentans]|nr:hypothetical protein N7513_000921 [Penicillium glabrum]
MVSRSASEAADSWCPSSAKSTVLWGAEPLAVQEPNDSALSQVWKLALFTRGKTDVPIKTLRDIPDYAAPKDAKDRPGSI